MTEPHTPIQVPSNEPVAAAPAPQPASNDVSNKSGFPDESSSLLKEEVLLHKALADDQVDLTKRRPWGDESGSDSDSDDEEEEYYGKKSNKKKKKLVMFGCCTVLCLFIAVVVVGAWLSADTANASPSQIAGYALLTVAGIITFFIILMCCTLCLSSCLGSLGGWSQSDFKEFNPDDVHQRRTRPRFIFKHWTDECRMDAHQHEALLKLTAKSLPKDARIEIKKALKARKEADKKRKAEVKAVVVDRLKKELGSGNADPFSIVRKLRKRVYVIDYHSARGATVEKLAAQITLILKVATPGQDLIVFRIESPGGFVSEYGLAAAQIMRLRQTGFQTIACVDQVAASGGYMMASVCDVINAAPFSFVGSIGVITYIPNLERVTKETLKVDVYRFTAGKYKRTVDVFGEVTEEDKTKLVAELQLIHDEFKDHVRQHRGSKLKADIDAVATGEGWLAANALSMGLVDRLVTSDQILLEFSKEFDVLIVTEFKVVKDNLLLDILKGDVQKNGIFATVSKGISKLFGFQPLKATMPQAVAQESAQATYQIV